MVSNAVQVNATINDSLIYLTAESLAQHNMDSYDHEYIRENVILLSEQVANMEIKIEDMSRIKDEIISPIQSMNKGTVKKVTTYKGKITKIDAGGLFQWYS